MSNKTKAYEMYKELRYKGSCPLAEQGIPVMRPEDALMVAKMRVRDGIGKTMMLGDWAISHTEWTDRGYYGGYDCHTTEPLPPFLREQAEVGGWDPNHLSVRVRVDVSEWNETVEETIRGAGYDLEEARGVQRSRMFRGGPEYIDAERPEHHSVLFDMGGPRDRLQYHWVTYNEKMWNVPKGMARGPARALDHARRRFHANAMADHAASCLSGDTQEYWIRFEVLWRGQVVGYADICGCEMTHRGPFEGGLTFEEQVTNAIWEHQLYEEAWDNALEWADNAVDEAKAKAARIMEGIALLPEYSLSRVREEFDRKVINMNVKKEA